MRRIYYLARRKLGLSPEEWDRLPWWQQRMYLEGYVEEGIIEKGNDEQQSRRNSDVVREDVHQSGGTTIIDRDHKATFGLKPGELTKFSGIQEQTL